MLFTTNCKQVQVKKLITKNQTPIVVVTDHYELHKVFHQKALLILFPGGGGSPENIKKEFKILEKAKKNQVSVVLMRFTNKLWIETDDCKKITSQIEKVIKENHLDVENIYIGGMSLGGTIAFSISQYLLKHSSLQPKGAFIIDSPIDLIALYKSSIKTIQRKDFSEERLAEPKWIVNYFDDRLGQKDSLLSNIQKVSPFTLKTKNFQNISALKNIKTRLYIEPDILWFKQNRKTDFENSNAYTIQKMYIILKENGWNKISLIETKNKGYRSNGVRNPHSWSIVNVDDLLKWMLNNAYD